MLITIEIISGFSMGLFLIIGFIYLRFVASSCVRFSISTHGIYVILLCILFCISSVGFIMSEPQKSTPKPQKTISDCIAGKTTLLEDIVERSLNEKEKVKIEEGCSKEFPTMGASHPTKEETKMIIDCIAGKTSLLEDVIGRRLNEKEEIKIKGSCSNEVLTMEKENQNFFLKNKPREMFLKSISIPFLLLGLFGLIAISVIDSCPKK